MQIIRVIEYNFKLLYMYYKDIFLTYIALIIIFTFKIMA